MGFAFRHQTLALGLTVAIASSVVVGAQERVPVTRFLAECREPTSELRQVTVQAVRDAVGGATCEETDALLSTTRVLNLERKNIRDLFPIGDLIELRELYLGGNRVVDLRDADSLSSLEVLDLSHNPIRDIAGIGLFFSLERLGLAGAHLVRDWSPLAELTTLKELVVRASRTGGEALPSISGEALASNRHLRRILFQGLRLDHSEALEDLSELELFECRECVLGSTRFLRELHGLRRLILAQSPLAGLPSLEDLDELREIDLRETGIRSLRFLDGLRRLETLEVSNNLELRSLDGVEGLRRLRVLRAEATRVGSLRPVRALRALEELNLKREFYRAERGDSVIRDLRPLANLTQLRVLNLSGHRVASLAPLSGLEALENLDVSLYGIVEIDGRTGGHVVPVERDTVFTDLSPLGGISSLRLLSARGARIRRVEALSELTLLEQLDLSGNEVVDLSPLAGLSGLLSLYLGGNSFSDLRPLMDLPSLAEVDLGTSRWTSAFHETAQMHELARPCRRVAWSEITESEGGLIRSEPFDYRQFWDASCERVAPSATDAPRS